MLHRRSKFSNSRWIACMAVALCSVAISEARAQYPLPRRPIAQTPPLSPYLDLLSAQRGPLPTYFEMVRPRQQLYSSLQRQERAIQRQQQQLQTLDRRLDSSIRTGVAPTGVRGVFGDYSHFYPGLGRR